MFQDIEVANISTDRLFLNADAGFDTNDFRAFCYKNNITANVDQNSGNGNTPEYLFDELLCKCRFVIERTNAWMDAFKAILVRFETN